MKRRFITKFMAMLLIAVVFVPMMAPMASASASPDDRNATLSRHEIWINGVQTDIRGYLIGGTNHIRLRDLGRALNIFVGFDNDTKTVLIDTNQPYDGPASSSANLPQTAVASPSRQRFSINGTAYFLHTDELVINGTLIPARYGSRMINGNNYVQLRSIAALFEIAVDFTASDRRVDIDTVLDASGHSRLSTIMFPRAPRAGAAPATPTPSTPSNPPATNYPAWGPRDWPTSNSQREMGGGWPIPTHPHGFPDTNNVELWTEEFVYQRLIALKEKYPDGSREMYARNCGAFASLISADVFDIVDYVNIRLTHGRKLANVDQIRVGDRVGIRNSVGGRHAVVILARSATHITVVEGNVNDGMVLWGRTFTISQFKNVFIEGYTRYPHYNCSDECITSNEPVYIF